MRMFKVFFNIEKEEQWLNEQLQKGYLCITISGLGIYTFKKTDKRYVMRLDYQNYLSKKKFEEYKGLYEDFGWNYLKESRLSGRQYWQKVEGDQNKIFSDRESQGNYYKRLMGYSFVFGMLCLAFSNTADKDASLYHEGLWNMENTLFWKAFIFETPFVLLKLLPVFLFIIFGISFYKAYRKYSMFKEE